MRVREIVERIDRLAPFELAESWDHVGLQVGGPDDEVEGVLVALEADEATLDEAARLDCGLILAHHPLIFEPLARLTDEEPSARVALRAARERRAVVVAHTNLDKARGGLADLMAEALGLRGAQPLEPSAVDWLKLIGFVPPDDADLVRKALFSVGAGVIGEYEHCSWGVEGQGTFFAGEGASPVLGERGRDESVTEVRLEVVFPRRLRRRVVAAYVAAHPYEEPAFDIVPVENVLPGLGLGRLGVLPEPVSLAGLAADVAALVGLPSPRYAGDGARRVRRVACLPGSGGAALTGGLAAALAAVADVLVTGDVKYHEAREALDAGLALVDAPHDLTEEELVLRWSAALAEALGDAARLETYRRPRGVWRYREAAAEAVGVAVAVPEVPTSTAVPVPGTSSAAAVTDVPAAAVPEAPTSAAALDVPPSSAESAFEASRAAEPIARDLGVLSEPVGDSAPAVSVPGPDAGRESAPSGPAVYRLYTDGGARGNPGPAAVGVRLLAPDGTLVAEFGKTIGPATNNVAEYRALVSGLELALEHGVHRLTCLLDSELVVRQIEGAYKVKDVTLRVFHTEVQRLLARFDSVEVRHIRREENAEADRLVNEALDAPG
ncbi:MAG TPA: Nif3-like dinuclear metal center hexameric protein [Thermoleophilia bacterium]|nr:Nif3-like dinuclear metal center hexameric protein [Thermoleophilia bacterium]